MCRIAAYIGAETLLENIIIKPANSLVSQSLFARESDVRTNGDGFGVGWYSPKISINPALFTSIQPAWNDRNLLHLCSKIKSPCFFGHVRAASAGGVTHYNCHPFIYDRWMFMHNGGINDFELVKRHLRHLLEDDIYSWIKGDTDSEHIFALFLQMAKGRDLTHMNSLAQLIRDVFIKINELVAEFGKPGNSYLNICGTDGKRIFVTRHCSDRRFKPESMHYAVGSGFRLYKGRYHVKHEHGKARCILIASEKLNDFSQEWRTIPRHHLLITNSNLDIEIHRL